VSGVRCLLWTGGKRNRKGYGSVKVRGVKFSAHRFAYATFKGPIPCGLDVLHKCDNPACAEIAHLFLGTNQDNIDDRNAKVRQARGESSGRVKLTDAAVRDIRARWSAGSATQTAMAHEYGVASVTVSAICRRVSWRHVG
jgi:hypothetical protein